jgi:cytochrome c553
MKKLAMLFLALNVNAGDAVNGEAMYNSLGCSGCHGVSGVSSIPVYPSLAGKDTAFIVKQLKDFQTGARVDSTMNAMAPMAAGYEEDIGLYLFGE